ncbi:MAG: SDR family oxidoreductase [Candidatus Hydrogenedentota bacterium]
MEVLDMFSLKGKVALATGGAGLYGRQIVEALAEAGAKTFTAARNHDALEKVAAAHRDKGRDVTALQYDQSDEDSVLALRDQIMEQAGTIDILVNNSVARPMKNGFQSDASTFAYSMAVNATGLFVITRAFGDIMAEKESGSIINIGSIQGLIGPDPTIYRGTNMSGWSPDYFFHKGGIINFTRFVGSYYGLQNVRCNCVAPGGYQTPDHPEPFVRQYSDKTFLGRLATDTDLKGIIVFLASEASAYITGTTIPVDAGYTAK